MKKRRNLKARFLAGGLALFLAMGVGTPMVLAKGEEQIVQEETEVNLLEMIKSTDEDFSNPEYGSSEIHEHEYVNEAGEVRWYFSYLKEIDGYKKTANKEKYVGALWATREDNYPFNGDYVHLFYSVDDTLLRPFYVEDSELKTISKDGNERLQLKIGDKIYWKTKFITTIDDKVLKILDDFGIYRLSDNIFLLKNLINDMKKKGGIGMGFIVPQYLTADGLVGRYDILIDSETPYNHELNGCLITNDYLRGTIGYLAASEEEKIKTLERK